MDDYEDDYEDMEESYQESVNIRQDESHNDNIPYRPHYLGFLHQMLRN